MHLGQEPTSQTGRPSPNLLSKKKHVTSQDVMCWLLVSAGSPPNPALQRKLVSSMKLALGNTEAALLKAVGGISQDIKLVQCRAGGG